MANTFKFECKRCGEAVFSSSVKEGKQKLKEHLCSDIIDYGNMPIEEFVALVKERMNK